MKKSKEIKIHFLSVVKNNWQNNKQATQKTEPFYDVENVFKFMKKLAKKSLFYDLKGDKFAYLGDIKYETGPNNSQLVIGLFKSGRNEFRPSVVNRVTGDERKSPKNKGESDIEKTHFIFRIDRKSKETYLFLESNHFGLTPFNVINYLNKFTKDYCKDKKLNSKFSLGHFIIPRNNFLTELNRIKDAKIAEVYVDKKILRSDALNFSNRTVPVQDNVVLTVKATRQNSIKSTVLDFFNGFKKGNEIERIRLYGIDIDNNKTFIDTSFMAKFDYIKALLDQETGEAVTDDFWKDLLIIAKNF